MTEDYFWGIELNEEHPSETWDPEYKPDRAYSSYRGDHTLLIKQALLGPEVSGDYNVIEVETSGYKTDIKHPIAVLKPGAHQNAVLDLMFPDPPVTFKLVKGSGPIYLLGNHSVGVTEETAEEEDEDVDDFDEEEEFDDEDEQQPEETSADNANAGRKKKLAAASAVKSKRAKPSDD